MNAIAHQKPSAEAQREAVLRCTEWFGASGFVFLDDRPWPYMVKENSDGWWLYYWSHGNKNFVTMRKLTAEEADRFRPHALSPEKAALYAPND